MVLLGKIVLGAAGVGLAGAGVLCSDGLVQVKVIEKEPSGHHIDVIAPAMLAPIALHLAPRRCLAQAIQEIRPYVPVIRAELAALRDSEDMVLVEVKQPGEHVEVSKSRGSIVVDVDDEDKSVHVSAPIRAISSTIEELASANAAPI